jgi:hypothetical protein
MEVPHGPWWKVKGWIDEPEKRLQVQVRDFKQLDAANYQIALDVDAHVSCAGEWQQWQKGLLLVGATAVAEPAFRVSVVCDIEVSFDVGTFPPGVSLTPKVKELHVDLKGLNLRQVGNRIVQAEDPKGLGERLEDTLRDALKQGEPFLVSLANEAIARGLREGKGNVAPTALFKSAQGAPTKK